MCICKCLTLKILQFGFTNNSLRIYKNNSIYTLSENKKYYEKNEKLNIDYNEVIGHDYAFYLINDGSIFNTKERKILSVDSNYSVIERPNVDGFCTSRPGYYRTSNSIYNIITNKYVNTTELETIGDNCIDFMTPNSISSSFYLTKEHGICTSPTSNTLRYLENSINTPFGKYYAFYVEGEGKGICYNDENNNVLMVFKNDSINKPSINGIKIYETKANIVTQGEIIAPHFNEHCFYCDEIQTNNLYPRKICIDYKIYEYSKEYDDLLQCSPVNILCDPISIYFKSFFLSIDKKNIYSKNKMIYTSNNLIKTITGREDFVFVALTDNGDVILLDVTEEKNSLFDKSQIGTVIFENVESVKILR